MKIPDEVRLKSTLLNKGGRRSRSPGGSTTLDLDAWREHTRLQRARSSRWLRR